MERLAKAVQSAAKYREESYVVGKPIKTEYGDMPTGEYGLSLWDAADKAAEEVGFDEKGTMPIYLLIQPECWNDALDWAKSYQ